MFNCTSESPDNSVKEAKLDFQSTQLEIVPLEKSLDYFKELNSKQLAKKGLNNNDIDLEIDLSSLEQVDVTDTDAKLNIATATT